MRIGKAFFVAMAFVCCADAASAGNSTCWGNNTREDVACVQVTEKMLLSFRGKTMDYIRRKMNAQGREINNGLHFVSNYSRGGEGGAGYVNVTFEDGWATSVKSRELFDL